MGLQALVLGVLSTFCLAQLSSFSSTSTTTLPSFPSTSFQSNSFPSTSSSFPSTSSSFPSTSSSFPPISSGFSSTLSSFPSTPSFSSSSFPSNSFSSSTFPSTSFQPNSFSNSLSTSTFSNRIVSPSFAATPLPIQFSFPTGFTPQNLFLPKPPKISKKYTAGVYLPANISIPSDPTASATITNLVTKRDNKVVDGKGAKAIKALFDQNSFRSYNMEITPGNKAIMNQDPAKELPVHCRVTVDYNTPQAKTFADWGIGCGYKGSVGSLRICLDENHQDNHICRKLSFRVDSRAFHDKNHSEGPLIYGMESLFFGGMPVDLSMMSERTAYSLMNSVGMEGPLAVHAKLFLNGKYLGLFSFIQSVDEQFTKMHWPDDDRKGKGGLYKELWLNPRHMKNAKDYLHSGSSKDESFLKEVMAAMNTTALTGDAPQQFFDKYFDTKSLIDMVAFNAVIGSTDDWRQRHNFFLYIWQNKKVKKIVFIPWDYDRLDDAGSDTRGILKGQPWWNIQATATPMACNALIVTTQQQANLIGGSPAKIAWNKDILDQFPEDMNIPVTCDKFTQLMAAALAPKIRQRTRELASQISVGQIRSWWNTWNAQIKTALENDPAGPTYQMMLSQQDDLAQHFSNSLTRSVTEANQADNSYTPSFSSSSSFPSSSTFSASSSTFPASSSTFPASSSTGSKPLSTLSASSFSPAAPSFASPPFSTGITNTFAPAPPSGVVRG